MAKVKCKVPALDFTDFDTSFLRQCSTKDEALEMDGLIYELAQKVQGKKTCTVPCDLPKYKSELNFLSKLTLSKELKKYGDGYYIIWAFYTSLHVEEKVETFLFDFDSALVAIGGSLGLFLGWSCNSIVMSFIEFLSNWLMRGKKSKKISNPNTVISSNVGHYIPGSNNQYSNTHSDPWLGSALPKVSSD